MKSLWRMVLLLGLGCRRTTAPSPTSSRPARAEVSVTVDASRPDVPGDVPGATSELCERLMAAGRSDVLHARSVLGAFQLETLARFEVFARCIPSANGGAWVLALDEISRRPVTVATDPLVATGRWTLVHMSARAERVSVSPVLGQCGALGPEGGELTIQDDPSNPFGTRFAVMEGFDYDHDGEVEVFLRFESNEQGVSEAASSQRCGKVWTFRDGSIGVYAPAAPWRLENLRDVDRDGRPEVTTYGPYLGQLQYGETPPPINDERGPELVLHSLADGSFSMTDEAARAGTRASCDGLEADRSYGLTLPRVACARMRGSTGPRVLQDVARCCNDGGDCGADFCNSRREIRRWTALAPPVNLGP